MKTYCFILTKNFLIQKYIQDNLSGYQIAKIIGCNWSTIYKYIKIHKIQIHPKKKYYCIDCKTEISDKCHQRCIQCLHKFFINKNHPNWKGGKNHCIDCQKILSNRRAKRCKSCSKKANKNPNFKNNRKNMVYYCLCCDNKISDTNARYGSKKCQSCSHKGQLNPQYIHGQYLLSYPTSFSIKKRKYIRNRDNYECQFCKISEEKHLFKYGRILNIHHINYIKNDSNNSNLITLCVKCHMKSNYNRDYWFAYYNYIMDTKELRIKK